MEGEAACSAGRPASLPGTQCGRDQRSWSHQVSRDMGERETVAGVLCRHAYRVAGLVVAKCPQMTYSRTDSRCLLPRLVDWLVLPLSSSRRPQAQGAAAAIRSQLHLVR